MEEFAPMNRIVVLGEYILHLNDSLVNALKVVFPGEMDTKRPAATGWTERNIVSFNAANFRDLDKVYELLLISVKVSDGVGQIFVADKELALNLVAVRGRWLVCLEMVDLLVPHAEARDNARVRVAGWHWMSALDEFATEPLCVAELAII